MLLANLLSFGWTNSFGKYHAWIKALHITIRYIMIMFIWIIVKAYLFWKIFCYNFSEHPMEQWTLCHLIVIHYRLNCLLEANPTIQQICIVVMTINICLLIFIAPINLRFLFDLIVRPNICLMCMYSIRNLKSRLVLLLSCSYVAYPIPTATLIRSAEIIIKRHRKKTIPDRNFISNAFPSIQSSTTSSNCSIITLSKWRHRTKPWTALHL